MLKKYEKPKILMMNLVGNEQLCGSCADQGAKCISNDSNLKSMMIFLGAVDRDNDGDLSRKEYYDSKLFGNQREGCENIIEDYCKFTSTGNKLVAWS